MKLNRSQEINSESGLIGPRRKFKLHPGSNGSSDEENEEDDKELSSAGEDWTEAQPGGIPDKKLLLCSVII